MFKANSNLKMNIYNTLTRAKEEFVPWTPGEVKMYCCGPTVYDLLHVGNFRGAIFYNLLRNWLIKRGYNVKMVYNYTDVDDKIIHRAQKENVDSTVIANRYMQEFEKDFFRLGLKAHDANPKVSETMNEIIQFIEGLEKQNKAYSTQNGDVWYSILSFGDYGKLSNRNTEELKSGVRIESEESKREPLDFALWKHSKENEPSWDSKWGKGRPGWHIECSAMAKKHLGEQIDIHGGGLDLMFPHHENEIAQSEGLSNKQYVKYWVHNNLLNFGGAKMSKSLGNIMTAREFMDTYNPEILKFLMLSVHYRSVSDLSESAINIAVKALAKIYSAMVVANEYVEIDYTKKLLQSDYKVDEQNDLDSTFYRLISDAWLEVEKSFNEDFNTPEVFAKIYEVIRHFNNQVKRGLKANDILIKKSRTFLYFILQLGDLMSLFKEDPKSFLIQLDDMLLKELKFDRSEIDKIVLERSMARQNKDFKKSDELRDKLLNLGIAVMDTAQGSHWEVAK